jgi:hypothetical protein
MKMFTHKIISIMEMFEIGAFFFGLDNNNFFIILTSAIAFSAAIAFDIFYTITTEPIKFKKSNKISNKDILKKYASDLQIKSSKNNIKSLDEIEKESVIDAYTSEIFSYAVLLGYNPVIDWWEYDGIQHMIINNASAISDDGTYDSYPITEMDLISLEIEKDSYEYKSMVEHMKEKLDECKRKNIGFSRENIFNCEKEITNNA